MPWPMEADIYNGQFIHSLLWVSEGRSGLVSLLTGLKEIRHPRICPH